MKVSGNGESPWKRDEKELNLELAGKRDVKRFGLIIVLRKEQ